MGQHLLHTQCALPNIEPPLWIGAVALRRLLPPAVVIDAVASALRCARAPAGASHALACDVVGGSFHVKAAAMTAPRAVYLAKVNANFPDNPARGLPTIQGAAAMAPGAIAGRLDELVTGAVTGRQSGEEITLFDSVGIALADAAAALAAYERWESAGRDDAP